MLSPEHICAFSKDRKTSRGCIWSRALLCSHGSGPHISAGYRAVLFWCDSIVRSGRLNAVPSQHCSPEALKHFGDKHRLAVKRATEEKAYQMSSQWAVSCIIRAWASDKVEAQVWCPAAELCPPALLCVIRLLCRLPHETQLVVCSSPPHSPRLLSHPAMRD